MEITNENVNFISLHADAHYQNGKSSNATLNLNKSKEIMLILRTKIFLAFHLKYKYYISMRISLAAVFMEECITRASALPIVSSALPRTL